MSLRQKTMYTTRITTCRRFVFGFDTDCLATGRIDEFVTCGTNRDADLVLRTSRRDKLLRASGKDHHQSRFLNVLGTVETPDLARRPFRSWSVPGYDLRFRFVL